MTEKENKGITIAEAESNPDPVWEKEVPVWFVQHMVNHTKLVTTRMNALSEENREMEKIINDMRSYFIMKQQYEQMGKRLDIMSKRILDEITQRGRTNSKKRADHDEAYNRKRTAYDEYDETDYDD